MLIIFNKHDFAVYHEKDSHNIKKIKNKEWHHFLI